MVCSLVEAADIDKGLVGIDLEFLIRGDLANSREFHHFLRKHGFNATADNSITTRKVNLEQYYEGLEIISDEPKKWSTILAGLNAVLAFLKREDDVEVLRIARADGTHLVAQEPIFNDVKGPDKKKFRSQAPTKVLKMPRAKVPQNFSAATHFHFDADTWFANAKHAHQLVQALNNMVDDLPKHLPAGRYSDADKTKGGHFYASTSTIGTDPDFDMTDSASDYLSSLARSPEITRYMAMNIMPVAKRGDVEFRFMHSSLNINTIDSWFRVIAEMIVYAEGHAEGDIHRFRRHAEREAPDVVKFLDREAHRSFKSQDPMWIQSRPKKSMQRHFKPSMPVKKAPQAQSERHWQNHINDPGDDVAQIEDTLFFIENTLGGLRDQEDSATIDMLKDAQVDLEARLERLRPIQQDSLRESRIPRFNSKIILFLGDDSKLVITKSVGNRYFINGALRARADSLAELEMMLRDPIAERGGLVRTWADPR
jgi:hypothetical protein